MSGSEIMLGLGVTVLIVAVCLLYIAKGVAKQKQHHRPAH